MPKATWVLKRISDNQYLKDYDAILANCTFTTILLEAKHYQNENQVNDDIESWGETPGVNYIGSNPPHPPQ